jgi:radical SAM protein with 4Fe4S-binding SPASM domain
VITNGTLLTSLNKTLMNKLKNRVDSISVSLHGPPPLHDFLTQVKDCHNKVVSGIIALIDNKIDNTVLYTATSLNYKEIYETAKSLWDIGVNKFIINRFVPCGVEREIKKSVNLILTKEQLATCLKQIKEIEEKLGMITHFSNCFPYCILEVPFQEVQRYTKGCSAGCFFGGIDWDGNLKICNLSPDIIGNIFKEKISVLWSSKKMKKFRSLKWIPRKCKHCTILKECRAGCKATGKTIFSVDYYLEYD